MLYQRECENPVSSLESLFLYHIHYITLFRMVVKSLFEKFLYRSLVYRACWGFQMRNTPHCYLVGQMTKIKLDEISMVDYPAHMVNGFAIIKSASAEKSDAVMAALGQKSTNNMPTVTPEDITKALSELSTEDFTKALSERSDVADVLKSLTPDDSETKTDILKGLAPEVVAEFEKRDAQLAEFKKAADDAAENAKIEKSLRLDREAIESAKTDYENLAYDHDVVDPAIRKFAEANPEAGEVIATMLKAVNEQADGAIFKELGTTQAPKGEGDQLDAFAKALQKEDSKLSYSQALAKAFADPANKSLVDAHFKAGN